MSKPSRRKSREARKSVPGHRLNTQERRALKNKRQQNLAILRKAKDATGSKIEPRTKANNCKASAQTILEQQTEFEGVAGAQLKIWRAMLPSIIRKLAKIRDPRNPKMIKHKITVVMIFGLLLFLFRQQSRRSFNEVLTTPSVFYLLNKFFPEIDSIPHADTVARLLERIDLNEIEKIHISMIRDLIQKKKFKKLLIKNCIPISIDGTQKVVRNGQLQEDGWLLRTINTIAGKEYQQYVYVLEANITFHNGLNIPLSTEYCYLNVDTLSDLNAKQDCELNGFYRLADKLKKYFPRLKIIVLLDNLYACDNVLTYLKEKRWEFMIKLPAKLKALYDPLKKQRDNSKSIPGNQYHRERLQTFHWVNYIEYNENVVHVVGCIEQWESVSKDSGEIIKEYSEHTWISSMPLSIDNVYELCNLAARSRAFIEDSFNTEKNRGYQYGHVFSYNWTAMQGFHLLMRLAHALNALSEFTKYLKKYIRKLGLANTFNRILKAIEGRWLTKKWVEKELQLTPQLRFDL